MIKADFIVIGSGIAGLNFAINAAKFGSVVVITKKEIMESNTNYAQGGVAAVIDKSDNFNLHIKDTLEAGAGLCDKEAVQLMVREAPAEIRKLVNLGVGFNRNEGQLSLGKEGGHSKRRILHAGDMTGRDIERTLIFHTRSDSRITVYEQCIAIDFIVNNKTCIGVQALIDNKVEIFFGKAIILASGGLCQVYEKTSNPKIATGDGVAMAYRAGALISDLEFVQFHPTTLDKKNCPHFLISEAVRGEGAKLLNHDRKRFVDELLPRDIVTRAILTELRKGQVYLDIRQRGGSFIRNRFPSIYEKCYWYDIDMTKDLIPISPAAHYSSGGVKTNLNAETNIPGLYAFGEVACTGVHGANRLASNSLLESLVFSKKALDAAINYIRNVSLKVKKVKIQHVVNKNCGQLINKLKSTMWKNVGIIRNEKSLIRALRDIERIERLIKVEGVSINLVELRNMLLVSKLIAAAALTRKESRGGHYRDDYPDSKNEWEKRIVLSST